MFRNFVIFNANEARPGRFWLAPALMGVLFVLFGILILLVPRLLIALIAGFFMFIGILFLTFAWHARKRKDTQTYWHAEPGPSTWQGGQRL